MESRNAYKCVVNRIPVLHCLKLNIKKSDIVFSVEGIEQTEDLIGEFGEDSSFDAVTGGAQDPHRDFQFAGLLTACLAMFYHVTTIN